MDHELRRSKELFVSNLNGTTWLEIDGVQLVQPLCVMLLSAFLGFVYQGKQCRFSDLSLLFKVL